MSFVNWQNYFYRDDVGSQESLHIWVSVEDWIRKQRMRIFYSGDLPAGWFLFSSRLETSHCPPNLPSDSSAKWNMPFLGYLTLYRADSTKDRLFFPYVVEESKVGVRLVIFWSLPFSLCNQRAILYLWIWRADVNALLHECGVLFLARWLGTLHLILFLWPEEES